MPLSSSTTPKSARPSRKIQENPLYPPQPGVRTTNEQRKQAAAAAASTASPSTKKTPPKTKTATSTPKSISKPGKEKPSEQGNDDNEDNSSAPAIVDANGRDSDSERAEVRSRFDALEKRMQQMEEEKEVMKKEVWVMRDKFEEEVHRNNLLQAKVDDMGEEVKSLKGALEEEKAKGNENRNGGGERNQDGWRKEVKEVEERLEKKVRDIDKNGGGGRNEANRAESLTKKNRCVILTDSNGGGATSDSIKNHIPKESRNDYDIEVVVAYTTEDAFRRLARGNIDVRGTTVVIDNLTNDVRGTSSRPAVSPQELVHCVDKLRGKLRNAGASAVVVCELKPMQVTDVTPYNKLLSQYLREVPDGFGCRTQIRLEFLKSDGFHILPRYDSIIDKTYACAIMGVPVTCPTPSDAFAPYHVRQKWEKEWPKAGSGGRPMNQGWRG